MKITINKDSLLDGLQRVFSIVPQKPTLPVLSNFLIKSSEGSISISGTDMDISITTNVDCSVEEDGAVTVNAKRFLGVIRELPSGDINISVENERVTVDFSKGQSSIMGMSAADYPALKDTIEGIEVTIPGKDLVEMVDKTAFSVSQDRTRLTLTGIYWKVSPDSMVMVSTDGHRLSLLERRMEISTAGEAEVVVPPKSLNQAAQIISGGDEMKKIIFGERMIFFDFGTTKIFSKLIEGPYPNYRQVIPLSNSKKVYISNEELAAAVRRVSVLSNSLTHQIRMELSSGNVDLATKNEDIGGEARESVDVRYEGDPMMAAYNANFLGEILRKIETDEVLLEVESPTTACILKPFDQKETDSYIYLIMPLRLSD